MAQTCNFRAAAETLHIAQPAVSRAVQLLETDLGLKLLERSTRHVSLTPAGEILARDFERAIMIIERSVRNARQVADGEAGEIKVAFSAQTESSMVTDLIVGFREKRPHATLNLYSLASHDQVNAIERGDIDAGFMLTAACGPSLAHIPLKRDRLVVLVSRDHRFATRTNVALRELIDERFVIGTEERWRTFRFILQSACLTAGFVPTVAEEVDGVPVLLRLVSLQRGITLFGSSIAQALPPDVVAISLSDAHASFDVSIAWDDRRNVPLVQDFVAFAAHVRSKV